MNHWSLIIIDLMYDKNKYKEPYSRSRVNVPTLHEPLCCTPASARVSLHHQRHTAPPESPPKKRKCGVWDA
jgi:hypothetical protein